MTRSRHQSTRARETIVVFAREPVAGQTKTRLIPQLGANGAAALAQAFIVDTLTKTRATGRRIVIAAATPNGVERSAYFRRIARRYGAGLIDQGDGTLGVRMRRAMAPFCPSGVFLIGTDIPSLPASILTRNLSTLRRHPVILAPSADGGYYLVGVRGPLPDIFRGVHWGTARVLAETLGRLRRTRTDCAIAAGWYDVDRWSDLLALTAELRLTAPRRAHPCPATARTLARLGLLCPRG